MSVQSAMEMYASDSGDDAEPEASLVEPGTEAAPTEPDAPEAAPADEATLRREIQAEKLAAIREKSAEQKAKREAARILDEAKRDRELAAAELAKLDDLKKDWRKLPDVLGVSAHEVLQMMTDQAIKDGTPEAAMERLQAQLPELVRAEVEPLKAENEALKAQLAEWQEERRAAAEERQLAQNVETFKSIVASPDYAELANSYAEDYLLQSASALGKYWQSQGLSYKLPDIADALLSSHREQESKRRREPVQDQRIPTVNGAEVTAGIVGNSTAAGTTGAPALSRKERIAKLSRGR
ncbi:MAG: hypothetical protein KBC95_05145 [Candidatus Peribacteraceae bacterium]|nr:hypothetical protein [Candidatus Peribacteraceae bacterium]